MSFSDQQIHHLSFCFYLFMVLSMFVSSYFSFYKDPGITGLGADSTPVWLHLQEVVIWPYFLRKPLFEAVELRTSTYIPGPTPNSTILSRIKMLSKSWTQLDLSPTVGSPHSENRFYSWSKMGFLLYLKMKFSWDWEMEACSICLNSFFF